MHDRAERAADARDPQPVAEQARLERAGDAELAEHDEHEHVARHRQRQHQRPVEDRADRGSRRTTRAARARRRGRGCRRRRRARGRRCCAARRGAGCARSGRSAALADEAGREREQRRDDHERDRRPRRPPSPTVRCAAPAGRRRLSANPGRASARSRRGCSGPACATSIGSVFTVCPGGAVLGRDLRVHRELAALDDLLLRRRRGEVLDELRACAFLVGRRHDARARHVGVRTGAVLVGPRRRDREVGVLVERAAPGSSGW